MVEVGLGALIMGAVILIVSSALVARWSVVQRLKAEHELHLRERVAEVRNESLARSRHTIKGRVAEQLAPLLPEFPYDPSEARFIGGPIDYIIFEGYSAIKNRTAKELDSIVFVEIKRGKAKLSREEIRIRDCVQEKRVRWETINLPDTELFPEIARRAGIDGTASHRLTAEG